ncbi:hypothetical protein D3C81_2063640 [compost metagenome]
MTGTTHQHGSPRREEVDTEHVHEVDQPQQQRSAHPAIGEQQGQRQALLAWLTDDQGRLCIDLQVRLDAQEYDPDAVDFASSQNTPLQ